MFGYEDELQYKIKELEAENKKMREALDFYAQEENHKVVTINNQNLECKAIDDGGRRARQALKELKGE